MTTARWGARPWAVVNDWTSSATAVRISAAIGAPSSRRAPLASTRSSGGRWRGQRVAPFTPADDLTGLLGQAFDLVEEVVHADRHLVLERRVADRWQVDHHVGGG